MADAEEARPDLRHDAQPRHRQGLNRMENHEECLAMVRKSIDETAAAGFPNVITLLRQPRRMDDEEGLKNCVIGLKKIAPYAEQKKSPSAWSCSTRTTTGLHGRLDQLVRRAGPSGRLAAREGALRHLSCRA